MNVSKNLVGLVVLVILSWTPLAAQGALVSHYAMEGDSTDSQGVQNGVLIGGPTTVTGKIGNAISFNPANPNAAERTQNMPVADPGGAHTPVDITISTWVKTTEVGSFIGLVDKIQNSYGILLDITAGVARFTTGNSAESIPTSVTLSSLGSINDGNWHLVTGTFQADGGPGGTGTATLYVNGVLQASAASFYEGRAVSMNVAGDIPVSSTFALDGILDDVSLWSVALSAGESRALFSLADTLALNYDAAFASELFNLHNLASGSAVVDGTTWYYRTDLGGTLGDVVDLGGGDYALRLGDSGTGVSTIPIPEPASSVLLAFGLFALGAFRRRR